MIDNSLLSKHLEIINKHYPNMNITQLGMVTLYLGILRASMGHEYAESTLRDYIHTNNLSKDIRKCVDYLEREVFGLTPSKLDIGLWRRTEKREKEYVSD